MTSVNPIAEAAIKRDRSIVLSGLYVIVVFAVTYIVGMAQTVNEVPAMLVQHQHTAHGDSFLNLFIMWTVMQIAMMSPTAVPMILMHTKVQRTRYLDQSSVPFTAIFFLGYIIVWTGFSAAFAALQMGLQSLSLLTPQMASANPWLAGGILVAAGLFQFSKLKEVCLNGCRSPVTYFMLEWREGKSGALLMGLKHGLHCVGCCWVLMALLFVAGVMNLLWMAMITVFVLLEKVLPKGDVFGRIGGVAMIAWGVAIVALPFLR